LICFSAYTQTSITRETASDWQFARKLSTTGAVKSGSSQNMEKARLSLSTYQQRKRQTQFEV